MSANSKIEWTDATWNPIRGCTKISPGCAHCYAETFAERFRGVAGHPYEQGFDLRLVPEKLVEPITWSRPRTVFVNSMSDLFHEGIRDEYVALVTQVMAEGDWHVYQVLTKRSDRMCQLLQTSLRFAAEFSHLVGRQRRESAARAAANRASSRCESGRCVPVDRTPPGGLGGN